MRCQAQRREFAVRRGGLRRYMQCHGERCNGTAPHCTSCQSDKFLLPVSVRAVAVSSARDVFLLRCAKRLLNARCEQWSERGRGWRMSAVSVHMSVRCSCCCSLCTRCVRSALIKKKKKKLWLFTASHSLPSTPQPGPCNAPHFRKNIDLAMKKRNTSNRYNSLNGDYSSDRIKKKTKK